jgi:hypothetical protein
MPSRTISSSSMTRTRGLAISIECTK